MSKSKDHTKNTKCFPPDHDAILSQRDVYVVPKNADKSAYTLARQVQEIVTIENSILFMALSIHSFSSHSLFQSHFTTHSFRFAEVCCTKEPPKGVRALLYRTAVPEWGECFIIIRIDLSSQCT